MNQSTAKTKGIPITINMENHHAYQKVSTSKPFEKNEYIYKRIPPAPLKVKNDKLKFSYFNISLPFYLSL